MTGTTPTSVEQLVRNRSHSSLVTPSTYQHHYISALCKQLAIIRWYMPMFSLLSGNYFKYDPNKMGQFYTSNRFGIGVSLSIFNPIPASTQWNFLKYIFIFLKGAYRTFLGFHCEHMINSDVFMYMHHLTRWRDSEYGVRSWGAMHIRRVSDRARVSPIIL